MSMTAVCPACDAEIEPSFAPEIGRRLNCPLCNAALKIIWMDPLELDWWEEDEDDSLDGIYAETDEEEDEDEDIFFGLAFLDQYGDNVFEFDDGLEE